MSDLLDLIERLAGNPDGPLSAVDRLRLYAMELDVPPPDFDDAAALAELLDDVLAFFLALPSKQPETEL